MKRYRHRASRITTLAEAVLTNEISLAKAQRQLDADEQASSTAESVQRHALPRRNSGTPNGRHNRIIPRRSQKVGAI